MRYRAPYRLDPLHFAEVGVSPALGYRDIAEPEWIKAGAPSPAGMIARYARFVRVAGVTRAAESGPARGRYTWHGR
ncbi:hypothetical protein AB0C50_32390, partial [Micromonospora taraxaci]|uniref:hypothetical protein n=1 Tax=Micromonospora taraxaci TaxID=1316803 RepID=UPI00340F2B64